MRIYVEKINPNLKKLNKYLQKTYKYIQLYSLNGIYNVESSTIYFLQDNSHHSLCKLIQYKSYSFITDYAEYTKTPVLSQLPLDYVSMKMETFEYSINAKSALKLVIHISDNPNFPLQFYFSTNEKLDESFILQDLDELLLCFYS